MTLAQPDSAGTGAAPRSSLPLFMTLREGLEQLTGKLAEHLDKTRLHLGRRVVGIELAPGGPGGRVDSCSRRYQIFCDGGVTFDADAIILAMPAHECGRLLSSIAPPLGALLGEIPYSSSMTVSLGYGEGTREHLHIGPATGECWPAPSCIASSTIALRREGAASLFSWAARETRKS